MVSRVLVWLVASVLRTASPRAPLICWATLVMPEPSPASAFLPLLHEDGARAEAVD